MNPLTTLVRSLGTDGAVANVRAVLEERRREDWLVQGLARRLEQSAGSGAVAVAPGVVDAVA